MSWAATIAIGSKMTMDFFGGMKSSKAKKKMAVQTMRAARINATILEGNAKEVLETARINSDIALYNVDAIRRATAYNELTALKTAEQIEQSTELEAERIWTQAKRMAATQTVAYSGTSGVDLGGSAYDVMRDTELENNLTALITISNGLRESDYHKSEATNIAEKGSMDAWNLDQQRKEELRLAAINSENLKKEAQLVMMKGEASASSYKAQARSDLLSTGSDLAGSAYAMSGQFGGGEKGEET